ncbi:6-phosphogluconolactonase [Nocardioides aurantiacus]|uniref:6-phosphogluconolactonase n=1 Tax=Nocardioides aurantiacus TaxID=86796 RepID=A0A3N2CSU6_9ACTN|nr:6-phosphogluconolactonase [Nocardioides aurantiacus]ROR90627.1 6-phosphogluconolactonase [Nocardioides aurantiacus]
MTDLKRYPDAAGLVSAVAEAFVARLAEVQAEGRVPSVALTGGTIADEIYRAVAALDSSAVDWTQVDFWWGDERYVAADSSDRNDRGVGRDLLDVVGVDALRVHAMPAADESHADVHAAADAYGEAVRSSGGGAFDLVLLGLGPDGHVASLFPDHPQLDVDDAIALGVTDSPKPPPERITLTFAALNRTRAVWFLVSGDGKADAVARALADVGSVHDTPARGITAPDRTWWLDEAAASKL